MRSRDSKHDMGSAIRVRGLELSAPCIARTETGAAPRGSGDIAVLALEPALFVGPSGNASEEVEPGDLAHCSAVYFIDVDRWQWLQGKDLALCLRSRCNAIAVRKALKHADWIVMRAIGYRFFCCCFRQARPVNP